MQHGTHVQHGKQITASKLAASRSRFDAVLLHLNEQTLARVASE